MAGHHCAANVKVLFVNGTSLEFLSKNGSSDINDNDKASVIVGESISDRSRDGDLQYKARMANPTHDEYSTLKIPTAS